MLRPLRRLRYLLLPLYAAALLAFVGRLGWAHDPTCPHHAGHAAPNAGHATAATRAVHASHAAVASHAAHAAPTAHAAHAPADSGQKSGDTDCRCLDPDCCLAGPVAVLDADAGDVIAVGATSFDASRRPMPKSVARPGAYSTHRLPFPHAPPRIDGLT